MEVIPEATSSKSQIIKERKKKTKNSKFIFNGFGNKHQPIWKKNKRNHSDSWNEERNKPSCMRATFWFWDSTDNLAARKRFEAEEDTATWPSFEDDDEEEQYEE